MKFKLILLLLFAIVSSVYSQKEISGRSKTGKGIFSPTFVKGIPSKLKFEISFKDSNLNGVLEAKENALLKVILENVGEGKAQGLKVDINFANNIGIKIGNLPKLDFLPPGRKVELEIPIFTNDKLTSSNNFVTVQVKEHFGFNSEERRISFRTKCIDKPEFQICGVEIIEMENGTLEKDGKLQVGEMAEVNILVKNIGSKDSESTIFLVKSDDQNIFLKNSNSNLFSLSKGQTKEIKFIIRPNQKVTPTEKLPVYLTLFSDDKESNIKNYNLPISLSYYVKREFSTNLGEIIDITNIKQLPVRRKNSVAVIIGVENYKNLPPAPYASKDAEIVKEYFIKRLGVEQVVTYSNEQVSGLIFDDIFNPEYGELQKTILKGKTDLYVFYSGHGIPSKDGENIYLFPSDGKLARLDVQGYNINKFYKNLNKLGAKSVTVFMDACFSGASRTTEKIKTENLVAMKGVKIRPKTNSPWLNNKNFTLFTSSTGDQTSLGFDQSGTGLFTYFLCAGLNGNADLNKDNKITSGELKAYVTSNVVETSKKIRGLQTPLFNGDESKVLIEY